ncbi:esterase-like activity of phytase family protein [Pseudomonas sp. S 311-6]|uniref:esterase-like activity of phytase family protein n=1 Tax=Pseudomonas TaxID=286 RepID=UPI001CE3C607|nr:MULTISPECIES: esterase-like activity of phytase family protein [Pseudomonas]MCO7641016.1 esterase-like activity of phytase family protein [Pseudomonas sp. S 311-6]MCO7567271.1 esterase-like activity of phytase family protein [Pseudomonas mosselii]MCO7594405.1 esterase-like activity of phytase family protein [Pseudomonas guariconensis]MCO7617741.1 esterase-like activity of phytase family protein [Pseudomonas guariconensis]MCO7632424.1 esterase-like activity of phytase family protein [Pseudom
MIRLLLAACLTLLAMPSLAGNWPELKLVDEHPVEGMRGANLSGLAECRGALWAISDRDDDRIYRLDQTNRVMRAQPLVFTPPPAPESGLPWGLKSRNWAVSFLRGGELDFEGVSCDQAGNFYLVSEAHAAVLQVPAEGEPEWLKIDQAMVRQARASGMLLHFNALFEGLAVNPAGDRLWLAAERERRGLVAIQRQQSVWTCGRSCVLLSEAGVEMQPPQMPSPQARSRDFSDLALYQGKLFTLERNAFRICRRDADSGKVERCWSFAADALVDSRRYDQPFGLAEALVIDAKGAWIGLDNNGGDRADGETRPIVWRFAAPEGGWSAKP